MGKITPSWLLAGLSGSIGQNERIYTRTNRQTGKVHTAMLCNPYQGDPSEKQVKARSRFSIIASAVSQWVKTEHEKEGGQGSAAYNRVLAEFRNQHEYGSLRGYITKKYVVFDEETQTASVQI